MHFHRKTGDPAVLIAMGEETTFSAGGKESTVPTHEFNAEYRPGEAYETAAGQFDYPEGYGKPAPKAVKAKPAARSKRSARAKAKPAAKPAAPKAGLTPTQLRGRNSRPLA